jgi:hypothetical protein
VWETAGLVPGSDERINKNPNYYDSVGQVSVICDDKKDEIEKRPSEPPFCSRLVKPPSHHKFRNDDVVTLVSCGVCVRGWTTVVETGLRDGIHSVTSVFTKPITFIYCFFFSVLETGEFQNREKM